MQDKVSNPVSVNLPAITIWIQTVCLSDVEGTVLLSNLGLPRKRTSFGLYRVTRDNLDWFTGITFHQRLRAPPINLDRYESALTDIMSIRELTPSDLQAILAFTINLARKAGDVILEGSEAIQQQTGSTIDEKKNSVDLVTEYDVKVEDLVKDEIASAYPDFMLCVFGFKFRF